MRPRRKAPPGIVYFKSKMSALHTDMFIRMMRGREIDPASLGELLEDMGNQFLDLSEVIRLRILASHRSRARARPCRAAGGYRR